MMENTISVPAQQGADISVWRFDVPAASTHWDAATYLMQLGIVEGYPNPDGGDNLLAVAEPIKRKHVAVILCRLLDYAQ